MIFHAPPHFQVTWPDIPVPPLGAAGSVSDQVKFPIVIVVDSVWLKDYTHSSTSCDCIDVESMQLGATES